MNNFGTIVLIALGGIFLVWLGGSWKSDHLQKVHRQCMGKVKNIEMCNCRIAELDYGLSWKDYAPGVRIVFGMSEKDADNLVTAAISRCN